METQELFKYLEKRAGENLRGVVRYSQDSTDVPYLRDDVQEVRLESQVDRMLRRMRPESSSKEEMSFPFGDLHATLRIFDEAIILHFPLGADRGLVISLEPEAAAQLNSFVNGCLDRFGREGGPV